MVRSKLPAVLPGGVLMGDVLCRCWVACFILCMRVHEALALGVLVNGDQAGSDSRVEAFEPVPPTRASFW